MMIGLGLGLGLCNGASSSPYRTFELTHILGTGQSLALGAYGVPIRSTVQPYTNVMFDRPAPNAPYTTLNPLVESAFDGETMSSGMANQITALAPTHRALVTVAGLGATAYVGLKKGTATYNRALDQIEAGATAAAGLGLTHGVSVVTVIHGETDADLNNVAYDDDLAEWQADYEADIKAITGQTGTIPMLVSQCSSAGANNDVPLAQLRAHVEHPGVIVVVGPKYHLPTADPGVDDRHLSSHGYRHLGEDFAKAYDALIRNGSWEPVRPRSVSRAGAVITIQFHVPEPPLVFDTVRVAATTNQGFEWSGGGETITNVAITANDTVQITLSATPAPGGRVKYAQASTMRGNLRDSDATVGNYDLFNWCLHFNEVAP